METEEIKKLFDEKFGKAGKDRNCDSIGEMAGCDDCSHNIEWREEMRDWFIAKLSSLHSTWVKEIINELESNPNEDGSVSPNIQHWIEKKQSQLRRKYLSELLNSKE